MLSIILIFGSDEQRLKRSLSIFPKTASRGYDIILAGPKSDRVEKLAETYAATLVAAGRLRGEYKQHAFAALQQGWLFFFESGMLPDKHWQNAVMQFIATHDASQAAVCDYHIDDDDPAARQLETINRWRNRFSGGTGRQGLLIHAELLRALGGFKPWPACEDIDLLRCIQKRGALHTLPVCAHWPADEYKNGYLKITLMRALLQYGYYMGISPVCMAAWLGRED